jgi:hypothetical protein
MANNFQDAVGAVQKSFGQPQLHLGRFFLPWAGLDDPGFDQKEDFVIAPNWFNSAEGTDHLLLMRFWACLWAQNRIVFRFGAFGRRIQARN